MRPVWTGRGWLEEEVQAMSKYQGWLVSVALVATLACSLSGGGALPTVTPLPSTAAPPTATPSPEEAFPAPPPPDERQVRQNLVRATVQIVALQETGGRLEPIWTGSGTILSPDGLILTNAHVVTDPDPAYQPDALGIAVTVRSDQPPELRYLGQVLAVDIGLDLAVIQIATDLDGRPVDVGQLNLNYVSLGDSDALEIGDLLQILGYPGIGGETITFTEGVVSGFTRERGVEGRAWVKTDATIAGGNSGGLGANAQGQLVGIPTQVGYGGAERFADCRYLADTNGDGVINHNDNCIPVGGFINSLRPVNLAQALVEAARLGIAPKVGPTPQPVSPGRAEFANLVFAPDVTDNDQPTQIVTQLPSGATGLYAFWDYRGMSDGLSWEARWYYQDQYMPDVSWPPGPWQGGQQGNWWIGITNPSGLNDGTYRLELYFEGSMLLQGSISIGSTAAGPAFTNLVFSEGITADNRPTHPTHLLPSGITDVYAFFDYSGMQNGMAWRRVWSYGGRQVATGSGTWNQGPTGSSWVGLSADNPLSPGSYRLELFVENALVAASDFTVAGTRGQEAIGPITFASGVDAQGRPVGAGTSFPSGLTELHLFFTYTGMQDGMQFEERWLYNGSELTTFSWAWNGGESGSFHDSIYRSSGQPLTDGEYTLALAIAGQQVQQGTAVIGTLAPTPTPSPSVGGLLIQGHIIDADTGRGIAGALYVVLHPGVTVQGWDGSQEQVYTWAQTDANGYFELPLALERGQRYSVIVWAQSYLPATGDNLLVGNEPSPLEVEIRLQRR